MWPKQQGPIGTAPWLPLLLKPFRAGVLNPPWTWEANCIVGPGLLNLRSFSTQNNMQPSSLLPSVVTASTGDIHWVASVVCAFRDTELVKDKESGKTGDQRGAKASGISETHTILEATRGSSLERPLTL